jgi:hypothetical protein
VFIESKPFENHIKLSNLLRENLFFSDMLNQFLPVLIQLLLNYKLVYTKFQFINDLLELGFSNDFLSFIETVHQDNQAFHLQLELLHIQLCNYILKYIFLEDIILDTQIEEVGETVSILVRSASKQLLTLPDEGNLDVVVELWRELELVMS